MSRHEEIRTSYKQLGNIGTLYDGIITRSTLTGKLLDSLVWGLNREDYGSDEEFALAGIDALADFIKEMGLPTTLRDIGFGEKEAAMLPEIAESCYISGGAFRPLTKEEILEIYREVL